VPAEIEPPELAQLVDFSERPRVDDWSLRAALVRYAQPQPARVEALLDLVRRTEFAIGKHNKLLVKEGPRIWAELAAGGNEDPVVPLLRVAQEIDELADTVAAWAVNRDGTRPDDDVDEVIETVAQQLDVLGVPHEERVRPPRGRG
jgi:hypothetical protein